MENVFTLDTTGKLYWVKYKVWKTKNAHQKRILRIGLLL